MSAAAPKTREGDRAELFRRRRGLAAETPLRVVDGAREFAWASFSESGFPAPRDEDWKYTNVSAVARLAEVLVPPDGDLAPADRSELDDGRSAAAARLAFVGGRFSPEHSSIGPLPAGVSAGPLSALAVEHGPAIAAHLGRIAATQGSARAFAALNTALFEDGACLVLEEGVRLASPIHVVHVAGQERPEAESHGRMLVIAAEGSSASVLEEHVSPAAAGLASSVTEIVLGAAARVHHVRAVTGGVETVSALHLAARQERASVLRSTSVIAAGRLVRCGIDVELTAEGAECELTGLQVGAGRQHQDTHVYVHHAAPHCTSRQLFRSVLGGAARGVFTGKVLVDQDAQKTQAHQQNRNLLLSDGALADTRPQLEIHADDVRCTHGATIGRLDADALFYLRSRGLDVAQARRMLTEAFASRVLEDVALPELREPLAAAVNRRLAAMTAEEVP